MARADGRGAGRPVRRGPRGNAFKHLSKSYIESSVRAQVPAAERERYSERRSPFGPILAPLECGRRPRSDAGDANPNARRLFCRYTQDDLDAELPLRPPRAVQAWHSVLVPLQEVDMISRALVLRDAGNAAFAEDDLEDAASKYRFPSP